MYGMLEFKDVTYSQRTPYSKVTASNGTNVPKKISDFFAGKLTDQMFIGSNLIDIVFPEEVKEITPHMFSACSGLTSIDIPDSVTSIRKCAFIACSKLSNIKIPDNISNIESCAFTTCNELTSITWNGTTYTNKDEFNQALKDSGIATEDAWV